LTKIGCPGAGQWSLKAANSVVDNCEQSTLAFKILPDEDWHLSPKATLSSEFKAEHETKTEAAGAAHLAPNKAFWPSSRSAQLICLFNNLPDGDKHLSPSYVLSSCDNDVHLTNICGVGAMHLAPNKAFSVADKSAQLTF
jgi:hypothetical protein